MVEWKTEKDTKNKVIFFTGIAHIGEFENGVIELWRKFFIDSLPLNKDINWDVIRVELWLDSGRIIIFPAFEKNLERIESSGCQMFFYDLHEYYENLADSKISDKQFDAEVERKDYELIKKLISGLNMNEGSGHQLLFWSSNSEKIIQTRKIP